MDLAFKSPVDFLKKEGLIIALEKESVYNFKQELTLALSNYNDIDTKEMSGNIKEYESTLTGQAGKPDFQPNE
jgi:hypothetical protein